MYTHSLRSSTDKTESGEVCISQRERGYFLANTDTEVPHAPKVLISVAEAAYATRLLAFRVKDEIEPTQSGVMARPVPLAT